MFESVVRRGTQTRATHSRAGSLRAPRLSDQAASLVGASGTSSPSPDAVLGSAARVGGSTAQWAQHSDLKKFEWTPARPVWSYSSKPKNVRNGAARHTYSTSQTAAYYANPLTIFGLFFGFEL